MSDLIHRDDAREILEDGGFLERSLERLAALPAVTVGVKQIVFDQLNATVGEVGLEMVQDAEDAEFTGERPDLYGYVVSIPYDHATAILAALKPVAAPDGYCWPCHYAGSCAKHPVAAPVQYRDAGPSESAVYDRTGLPPVTVAAPDHDVVEIDLRAAMMEQIEEAASQSPWVPPEYMMNEIISDCCTFLREARAPDPAAIREAALREAADLVDTELMRWGFPPSDGCRRDEMRTAILALIQKGAADDRA